MKALFILPNLAAGGVERQWSILLPGLRERDIDARLIALDAGGPLEASLRRDRVPHEVLAMRNRYDVGRLAGSALIRHTAADVVVSQSVSGLYVGEVVSTLRRATHVYAEHAGATFAYSPRRAAMMRSLASRLDWVVAVSPEQRAPWLERRFPADRIVVIPNGVASAGPDGFASPGGPSSKAWLREELRIPADAVVALLVASLRPEKRVPDFIDALAAARRINPELVGVVAGDGPERAAVEGAAAGEPGIHLLGQRDDVPRLLSAADIFVLASEHEAVPMSILEAMAAGLPVVATGVGGVPGIVEHGESGWLVPPGDPAAMATRLVELAGDGQLRERMGAAGRDRQRARWDAVTMVDRYAEFLRAAAPPTRSTRPPASARTTRERIAMLLENNPYPKDVRVRHEAESLVGAGHEVTVVAPRGPGQPRHEWIAGVEVRRFRLPDGGRGGMRGFLLEYLVAGVALHLAAARALAGRATVLHIHNPPDILFPAGAMFRLAGRKVVFDHHDLFPDTVLVKFGDGLAARLAAAGQRLTFAVASHVLATNASYAEVALASGGKRAAEVTIVRNAPPVAWTRLPSRTRPGALRDVRLAYAGAIAVQDGVEGLAPVLARLRGELDVRLTIVGDGHAREELARAFDAHGVADCVAWTGWVEPDEVAELLGGADICVDPSPPSDVNQRSTMIKIAEYLALGKPVVAYRLLETERTAGDAARLVAPGDVDAFAEEILLLARDPALRAQLAEDARRRARELTWEHSEHALLAAYRALRSRT